MIFPRLRWPSSALPLRQLVFAVATSLIAHYALLVWAVEPFSLSFQGAGAAGALRTRTIEAPAAPRLEPMPSVKPESMPPPTPAPPAAATPASPMPPEPVSEAVPTIASLAQDASERAPLPLIESISTATKTVVIALSTESEASTSTAVTSTQAIPALELQLPSNAQLQFMATSVQRGQSREGRGQLTWQSDGQAYSLQIAAKMLLITVFESTSIGKITEVGLSPERFSERRGFRSEQATHFRTNLGKIQFSNNRPEAKLEGGAQDQLSVMLLLSSLFAGNPERIDVGSIIRVQVASTDSAETWDIRFDGQEEILLPAGPMKAFKLTRNARREFDRALEIWLAPSLGFLPVRILQSSPSLPKEDFFELKLLVLP